MRALPYTQVLLGPHSCHPWNQPFGPRGSPSPPPPLRLPAHGPAGSALSSCGPGILRCSGALICSTPGDQGLTFIQPQSYGSHTLCGLPQPEGRGAGAPRGGDWSPTTTSRHPPCNSFRAKCQFLASAPQMLPRGRLSPTPPRDLCPRLQCHTVPGTLPSLCSIKVWASPALLNVSTREGAGPEPLQTTQESVGKALHPVGPQSTHILAFVRLGCEAAVAVSLRVPGTW